jgi:ADP-ribosyl-[dinitrogen reductase] hydrolase
MVVHTDRTAGALLGLAVGDALGAGYEFESAPYEGAAEMIGGGLGGFAPGEWTDDTSMAICIAEVTAQGSTDPEEIAGRFLDWYGSHPPDAGNLTRVVLGRAEAPADVARLAAERFETHPDSCAGNGALMRTSPVALAHLGDDQSIVDTAQAISSITHADPVSGEACALWCIAIDRAISERRLDGIRDGLALLAPERAAFWDEKLTEAENDDPSRFRSNAYVLGALQAAHAAIVQTPVPYEHPSHHLQHALHRVIAIGHDTDTTAAIAGQLLGAYWGASAIPFRWRRLLHGWPGLRAHDLVSLAVRTAQRGGESGGWPGPERQRGHSRGYLAELPGDNGVLLGNLNSLEDATSRVDAVVSLCRVGTGQVPAELEHHEVILVDRSDDGSNPHLAAVLLDAAEAVRTLRGEGKRVFLHCVDGRSRTPTVAAVHLAVTEGISGREAWQRVAAAIPEAATHNDRFQRFLDDLAKGPTTRLHVPG